MPLAEKEMIQMLYQGTSTPLGNIQIAFVLTVWSSILLVIWGMVVHEKEKTGFNQAKNIRDLARDYAQRAEKSEFVRSKDIQD